MPWPVWVALGGPWWLWGLEGWKAGRNIRWRRISAALRKRHRGTTLALARIALTLLFFFFLPMDRSNYCGVCVCDNSSGSYRLWPPRAADIGIVDQTCAATTQLLWPKGW